MDFNHTPDRQMLADMLRRFFADKCPIDARNAAAYGRVGYDVERWADLVELGVTAALFPDEAGGFGGRGFDIMAVFEEVGRALAVEPFLGTLMTGHALIAAGGHPALDKIVAGALVTGFAHQEDGVDAPELIRTTATPDREGWVLDGAKAVVPHAEAAEAFLVSARTEAGLSLFFVPADTGGLSIRGYNTIDGGRSGELTLAGMRIGGAALVGSEGRGGALVQAAIDAGVLALSAEALGAMEIAKDMTLDYLRTRVQFGQPIGRFQALQHRMATVLLEIEQTRSAVINAAAAFGDADPVRRARALSAAKYTAGRTGTLVAEEAVQLHGGIGMTWELPLSHYAKRITMIDHQLGDEDYHLQRYIDLGRAAA